MVSVLECITISAAVVVLLNEDIGPGAGAESEGRRTGLNIDH
jgi:hypothetical protein